MLHIVYSTAQGAQAQPVIHVPFVTLALLFNLASQPTML
jgi:hypothetical protein